MNGIEDAESLATRSTWAWIKELSEQSASDEFATLLLHDLEALSINSWLHQPELCTSTIHEILTRILQQMASDEARRKSCVQPEVIKRAHHLLVLQSTRWILRRVLEFTMDTLLSTEKDVDFWNDRLVARRPLRDFIEKGPMAWFLFFTPHTNRLLPNDTSQSSQSSWSSMARRRSPQRLPMLTSLPTQIGLKPWISIFKLSGKMEVHQRVRDLHRARRRLQLRAGKLHHALASLGEYGQVDTEQRLVSVVEELYRIVSDLEPGPLEEPSDVVQAILDIVEHVPNLEARDSRCIDQQRRPGQFSRHWIAYTTTFVLTAIGVRWLFANRDLVAVAARTLRTAAIDFVHEHVTVPILAIQERLFLPRSPSVKREDVAKEKETLEVMLRDFGVSQIEADPSIIPEGVTRDQYEARLRQMCKEGDMSMVLSSYKKEISKPIYGLAAGQLLRNIFIQLQKLKVEMEASMVELDVMLEQNEVTLQLAAIVPAFLISYPFLRMLLYPIMKRRRSDTAQHRQMGEDIRAVHKLLICNYPKVNDQKETVEDTGVILTHMHRVLKCVRSLRSRKLISSTDAAMLEEDVALLVSLNFTVEQKKQLCRQMHLSYRFLNATM